MKLINARRIAALSLVVGCWVGAAGCTEHVDRHYQHDGYYDARNQWHGGYYDEDRHYHEDGADWHK